ncbi:uncharacterized protein LOC141886845 isoform X2 [Acropora palmata]|uniref:uncharacterized protein LOC141886845 isoform X2 n=1 Tax=Acropora palmata TaxID=6131 RepID=UPI003DA0E5BD
MCSPLWLQRLCVHELTEGDKQHRIRKSVAPKVEFFQSKGPMKVGDGLPSTIQALSRGCRFTTEDTIKWFYSYSPCGVFNKFINQNQTGYKACVKASVGRWTQESTHVCESLGDDSSAKFLSTKVGDDDGNIKSNLTLAFRNSISGHGAKISLICNETMAENEAIFEFINVTNMPTDTYYLALTSKCCCKGKCGIPPAIIPTRTTTGSPKGKAFYIELTVLNYSGETNNC